MNPMLQFRTRDDRVDTIDWINPEYASRIVGEWLAGSDTAVTFEGRGGSPDVKYDYTEITEIWLTR